MGHAILSEYREYERGTTASVNAAIQPVLRPLHLPAARTSFTGKRLRPRPAGHAGQRRHGLLAHRCRSRPSRPSCPAPPRASMAAAVYTAQERRTSSPTCMTYDMGGTSCDVGLIERQHPDRSVRNWSSNTPCRSMCRWSTVHTIGAGGGSLAYHQRRRHAPGRARERRGRRRVPSATRRGGTQPTITDANLVLGRLNPGRTCWRSTARCRLDQVMRNRGFRT